MNIQQLLDAAEPTSRYVPAATAELITGLANAVRQLTEQRDVLVADNWNLRDAMRQIITARPGGVYFNKWEPLIFKALNKTPATDAAIASLRAEGVEMAISHLIEKFKGTGIGVPVMALEHLARQLRESKGANHA
ncbi:hypothetical protein R0H17_15820 [Phytobacter diazotrophicus]|uniref:hypothetical protein n=1 Tax=Phytobacter diazotrophicus TaxID=395631 RepID=UPI0029367F6E|nr:hypothetical protein [Phytobacter diazotrophicus]MDV2903107.1 hypothetical protein [Phytobacter diazotrophicus]